MCKAYFPIVKKNNTTFTTLKLIKSLIMRSLIITLKQAMLLIAVIIVVTYSTKSNAENATDFMPGSYLLIENDFNNISFSSCQINRYDGSKEKLNLQHSLNRSLTLNNNSDVNLIELSSIKTSFSDLLSSYITCDGDDGKQHANLIFRSGTIYPLPINKKLYYVSLITKLSNMYSMNGDDSVGKPISTANVRLINYNTDELLGINCGLKRDGKEIVAKGYKCDYNYNNQCIPVTTANDNKGLYSMMFDLSSVNPPIKSYDKLIIECTTTDKKVYKLNFLATYPINDAYSFVVEIP